MFGFKNWISILLPLNSYGDAAIPVNWLNLIGYGYTFVPAGLPCPIGIVVSWLVTWLITGKDGPATDRLPVRPLNSNPEVYPDKFAVSYLSSPPTVVLPSNELI